MSYPYLYPGECPTLDDIREAMAEQRPMGADARSGLVGFWPGRHRGSILRDFSGNANTGTWYGTGTHWAVDAQQQGIVPTFNGTDDHIRAGTGKQLSAFSFVAWCKNVPYNGSDKIIVIRMETSSPYAANYRFSIAGFNELRLQTYDGGWQTVKCQASGFYGAATAFNTWRMVAVTWAAGTEQFYIDGQPVATTSGSITSPGNPSAPKLAIGSHVDYSSGFYAGLLDDLRIYSRALSAAEVKHIYDCGRVAPLSDLVEPVGWETVGVTGGVVVPWHLFGRVA